MILVYYLSVVDRVVADIISGSLKTYRFLTCFFLILGSIQSNKSQDSLSNWRNFGNILDTFLKCFTTVQITVVLLPDLFLLLLPSIHSFTWFFTILIIIFIWSIRVPHTFKNPLTRWPQKSLSNSIRQLPLKKPVQSKLGTKLTYIYIGIRNQ